MWIRRGRTEGNRRAATDFCSVRTFQTLGMDEGWGSSAVILRKVSWAAFWRNFAVLIAQLNAHSLRKGVIGIGCAESLPNSRDSHFDTTSKVWRALSVQNTDVFAGQIDVVHFDCRERKRGFAIVHFRNGLDDSYAFDGSISSVEAVRSEDLVYSNDSSVKWHGIVDNCSGANWRILGVNSWI